jgi:glycosyltransferase involved in cell wall biosynthesis
MHEGKVVVFAPTPSGGHPEYVMNLLAALAEVNPDYQIIWPVRPDLEERFEVDWAEQPRVIPEMQSRADLGSRRWFLSRILLKNRHDVGFVRWFLRSPAPKVVILEEIQRFTLPLLVAVVRIRGSFSVVHLHNLRRHDYRGTLRDRCDHWMTVRGLRIASLVVVHTDGAKDALLRAYPSLNVKVVPHGLRVAAAVPRMPPGLANFGLFGVLRPNKGLAVLVEAMKRLPFAAMLTVAGSPEGDYGHELDRILSQIDGVDRRDYFIPPTDIPAILSRLTALVLPYTSFAAQSGVLHLAMEYGLPVVVSDVGALGETVRAHKFGIVVPANDSAALAEALDQIRDPIRNVMLRRRCVEARSSISWEKSAEALELALLELRSRRPAAAAN